MQFKRLKLFLLLTALCGIILYIMTQKVFILIPTIICLVLFILSVLIKLQLNVKININQDNSLTELQKATYKRHSQNKFS